MKIDTFHVEGYGIWTDLKVERLSESLNVFHGPNEAGKTTLLQFVRSMFYGFPPQRRRYLPPLHGGQPGGTIDVAGPNGRFQIRRIYAENNGVPGEQLTITAPDGMRQGEHFLKVLLSNVDEAVFNNVFAIGLRDIQELNTLSDTDASEMLYNLTIGLDRVSLVEVLQELETSRNRLIDGQGRPCTVSQLLADRAKLLAEIEDLSAANNRYARIAAEHARIDADAVRLEEEANQAERQCEIMGPRRGGQGQMAPSGGTRRATRITRNSRRYAGKGNRTARLNQRANRTTAQTDRNCRRAARGAAARVQIVEDQRLAATSGRADRGRRRTRAVDHPAANGDRRVGGGNRPSASGIGRRGRSAGAFRRLLPAAARRC